jgi:hypothetical protein
MKQYVQTDLEADRQDGEHARGADHRHLLASIEIADDRATQAKPLVERPPVHQLHARGPFSVRERVSGLGSGGGI